ncbi:MAG: DegV family protein [Oscillospiraceae bacterium]|nr:DegV family protein [Oscillospiraceae bacterium]MBQ9148228.1 DegV family protein [Oscillospiraceae bacterium]
MSNYTIITDSGSDLPLEMLNELNLKMVPLNVLFKGETRDDCVDDSIKEIYNGLRAGEVATTSAINPDRWANTIEPELAAGKDVLVLAFSSGLSTTYQSAVIAANDLLEKYPGRKVYVVDTLCASLGEGLLVWYAAKKREEGMELEALRDWVEANKLHLCHWFTVDDLMFLKRGGRVSAATALVGTMLQIKPVLHVDDEGHLINVSKTRGRKGSIDALAKKVGELAGGFDNSTMFISHGDCREDAEYLAGILKEKYGVKEVIIGYVGAVIGAHAGPGVLALFFLGNHR